MTDVSGFLEPLLGKALPWLYVDSSWWTAFGLLGNALFSSRFVIQWLHSERKKQLTVPPIFWHLSFWGSAISLVYALHIGEDWKEVQEQAFPKADFLITGGKDSIYTRLENMGFSRSNNVDAKHLRRFVQNPWTSG